MLTKKYPIQKYYLYAFYLLITCLIFYISIKLGKNGINLKLDDGDFYWQQAQLILETGQADTITSIYIPIIGWILKYTAINSVLVIRLFNWCGFILLVNSVMKMIDIIFQNDYTNIVFYQKKKRFSYLIVIAIFAFWPSMWMMVDMSIYRDIWIYLFYVMAINRVMIIVLNKKYTLFNFLRLLIILYILGGLRKYALLAFLSATFFYIIMNKIIKYINIKKILIFLFFAMMIFYTLFFDRKIPLVNMSLQDAFSYRELFISGIYAGGGSQMYISLSQSNFIEFIINFIHSYIGNLIGPLPWHIRGISTAFVFIVETIPMIFILCFIFFNRKKIQLFGNFLLVQAFVWNAFIAISNDNVGAATRLRIIGWIPLLCVFSVLMATVICDNNINYTMIKLYIKNKFICIIKFVKNIVYSFKI